MARRRQLKTLADFQRALNQRYGLGENDSYKPWLRVQDVSSRGNSGKIQGLLANREHHTLSEHESCFFYLAEFCDSVIDIREQFPLLPLNLSINIASSLGVDHPIVVGSKDKQPNVMTTDFVLTRTDGVNIWYEAISVKPAEQLGDKRTAEKLDIERVWWELQGIPFHIFVMTEQNKIQSKNIQWFTSPYRQGRQLPEFLKHQAVILLSEGTALVEDLCNSFVNTLNIERDDALVLLKILMAEKLVKVDLNLPIADTGILNITAVSNHKVEKHLAS